MLAVVQREISLSKTSRIAFAAACAIRRLTFLRTPRGAQVQRLRRADRVRLRATAPTSPPASTSVEFKLAGYFDKPARPSRSSGRIDRIADLKLRADRPSPEQVRAHEDRDVSWGAPTLPQGASPPSFGLAIPTSSSRGSRSARFALPSPLVSDLGVESKLHPDEPWPSRAALLARRGPLAVAVRADFRRRGRHNGKNTASSRGGGGLAGVSPRKIATFRWIGGCPGWTRPVLSDGGAGSRTVRVLGRLLQDGNC